MVQATHAPLHNGATMFTLTNDYTAALALIASFSDVHITEGDYAEYVVVEDPTIG